MAVKKQQPQVPEALKKAANGLLKWRGTDWMGGSDVLTWVMKDGTYGFAVQGPPLRLQARCLSGEKSIFNNRGMGLDVSLQKHLGLDAVHIGDRYGGQIRGGAGQTMGEGNISIDELVEGITSSLDTALGTDGGTHFTLMPTKGMPWNAGSKCTPYYSANKQKVFCGTKPEGLIKTERYVETSKGSGYVKVNGIDFCTIAPLIKETEGGIVGTITAQDDDRFFLTHAFNLDEGSTTATTKAITKCGGLLYPSLAIADVPSTNFGTCCLVARLPLALRMLKPYKEGATRGVAPVTVYNTDAWTDVTRDFAGSSSAVLFEQMTGTWDVDYISHMMPLGPRLMEDVRSHGPDVKVLKSVSQVLKEFKRKRSRWTRNMTYADIEQASDDTDLRYPYMEVKVNGVLQIPDTFPLAVCPAYLKSKTQKFLKAIGFNGHLITIPVKGHFKDALQHKVPGLDVSAKAQWDYGWMVRDAILAWQEKQDAGKRYGDTSRWIEWVDEKIHRPSARAIRYGMAKAEDLQLFNTPTLVRSNPAKRQSADQEQEDEDLNELRITMQALLSSGTQSDLDFTYKRIEGRSYLTLARIKSLVKKYPKVVAKWFGGTDINYTKGGMGGGSDQDEPFKQSRVRKPVRYSPSSFAIVRRRRPNPSKKYAYHVTYMNRLAGIAENGLSPKAGGAMGRGGYAGHSSGRLFLSDAEGVDFWYERAETAASDLSDDPLGEGYTPVVLRMPMPSAKREDEPGAADSGSDAWYVTKTIPVGWKSHKSGHIEIWNGSAWIKIWDWETIDPRQAYQDDEDSYFRDENPLAQIGVPKSNPTSSVLRPSGWEATSEVAYDWLNKMSNRDKLFRGMTSAEYKATIGKGLPIHSKGKHSFSIEGTNFAEHAGDAESYVNFGRDDPRRTGTPTYLVEINKSADIKKESDGYWKTPKPVPLSQVSRLWKMWSDGSGNILIASISVPKSNPTKRKPRAKQPFHESHRKRLLQSANMFAMDFECDGGVIPPKIEKLLHAGHKKTRDDENRLIQWFLDTYPYDAYNFS